MNKTTLHKTALTLIIISILSLAGLIGFWNLASDAGTRSNVNVGPYDKKYVPAGMDSHEYSNQQDALMQKYAWTAFAFETLLVASFSAALTAAIISNHKHS